MERTFDEIYDEIVEDLRGNLTNEEYRELITLEYVVTQGYDKKGDYERYKELSEKKMENTKFKVGDKAVKVKGYKFPCTIVSVFQTVEGNVRVVGEMDDYGLLHIFNEEQLEKAN